MSNTIGSFQAQNGPYPAPAAPPPAPKRPRTPTWEIASVVGVTALAVAGGAYAYSKSSKSPRMATSYSLDHDSIASPGNVPPLYGPHDSRADANATARGAAARSLDTAAGHFIEVNGHRADLRDVHSVILAHIERLRLIEQPYGIRSPYNHFDMLWDRAPATRLNWEGPFRNQPTDLQHLLYRLNDAHLVRQHLNEADFVETEFNENTHLANLHALDENHPMVRAQRVLLQLIEEDRRREPDNRIEIGRSEPADTSLNQVIAPPSWKDLSRNEPIERPGSAHSDVTANRIENTPPIADARLAREAEQQIHKFRLWRAAGEIKAFKEVSDWKNRDGRSWGDAQAHALQILHEAHEPEVTDNAQGTGEFTHPLLKTGNDVWMGPTDEEKENLLHRLHEDTGYYTALGHFTKLNRQTIPSEIDVEQGLGQWLRGYQSLLTRESETWPAAEILREGDLSKLAHNALYQGLYNANADRDLGTTDGKNIVEATKPPRVRANEDTQNYVDDIEYKAQRLVDIERNIRMDPYFALDSHSEYELDLLRNYRLLKPEFAAAVRRAEARAPVAEPRPFRPRVV